MSLSISAAIAPCTTVSIRGRASAACKPATFKPSAPLRTHLQSSRGSAGRRAVSHSVIAVATAAPEFAVSVAEERLEGGKVLLNITIPAAQCQAEYKKVLSIYRNEANVPGFRKGKAPADVLIKHLGGQQAVNNSVLSELLGPAMEKAMEAYQSEVLADSELIEDKGEEMGARFDPKADFTFRVSFETMPQIKWKQPYRELAVSVEAAGSAESDAAAVEANLLKLRKASATLRVASARGLQRGDVAIIDFEAADAKTNDPLPGAKAEGRQLATDIADTTFLPGIVDFMTGMSVGETRTGPLTFPQSEAFEPAALRGVTANITVKLVELFEEELPELTDEWAEGVEAGIGGVAGLRARLAQNQAAQTEEATQRAITDAITGAVGAAVEVSFMPRSMVEEAGRRRYTEQLRELMENGLPYETVQQLADAVLVNQYIERKWDELAELQRAVMGFEDILAQEGLQATEQEIAAEMQEAVQQIQQYNADAIDLAALREQVKQTIETNKVMDWMKQNISVTMLPYNGSPASA